MNAVESEAKGVSANVMFKGCGETTALYFNVKFPTVAKTVAKTIANQTKTKPSRVLASSD